MYDKITENFSYRAPSLPATNVNKSTTLVE